MQAASQNGKGWSRITSNLGGHFNGFSSWGIYFSGIGERWYLNYDEHFSGGCGRGFFLKRLKVQKNFVSPSHRISGKT